MKLYDQLETDLELLKRRRRDNGAIDRIINIAEQAIEALEKETDRADQMTESRENMITKRDILSEEAGSLRGEVFALTEKLASTLSRFQLVCPHTYGKTYLGVGKAGVCTCCGWNLDLCQHKQSMSAGHKYCSDCGEKL